MTFFGIKLTRANIGIGLLVLAAVIFFILALTGHVTPSK